MKFVFAQPCHAVVWRCTTRRSASAPAAIQSQTNTYHREQICARVGKCANCAPDTTIGGVFSKTNFDRTDIIGAEDTSWAAR